MTRPFVGMMVGGVTFTLLALAGVAITGFEGHQLLCAVIGGAAALTGMVVGSLVAFRLTFGRWTP